MKSKFVGVDKKNLPVGPISEQECLNGTLHRSVTVVVFNDKGERLIQQRGLNRKLFPGLFTLSATGHVDWTENGPEDDEIAARREFQEELGKPAPKLLEYKFTRELNTPNHHIMSAVFIVKDNGPFFPNPNELQGVEFYKPEDIKNITEKLTPTAKMNLEGLGII